MVFCLTNFVKSIKICKGIIVCRITMDREKTVKYLSAASSVRRLKGVKILKKAEERDVSLVPDTKDENVLLSAHTFYSFSPYSPSRAAYRAYQSGLGVVGISDHDSLAGVGEFAAACDILGIECSRGLQLRCRFYSGMGRWLNSFYERDIGFVSIRGIPQREVAALDKEIAGIRARRAERARKMVEKFNSRLKKYGMVLNFERDVKAASMYRSGGTVTERHILYALAQKLIKKFGNADAILEFIQKNLGAEIEEEHLLALSDINNPYYAYDLVSCLKHEVRFFYVPADDVLSAKDVVSLAHRHGGLITYSYVGVAKRIYEDREETVVLEDGYLEELMRDLGHFGFDAIEYVPAGVSAERAELLSALAAENGMFTLPYSDLNSPRQLFVGEGDMPAELIRNTWAVVGHEKSVNYNLEDGLNTEKSKEKTPDLEARLILYAEIGRLRLK